MQDLLRELWIAGFHAGPPALIGLLLGRVWLGSVAATLGQLHGCPVPQLHGSIAYAISAACLLLTLNSSVLQQIECGSAQRRFELQELLQPSDHHQFVHAVRSTLCL
eukprot:GHRR01033500.1.p1 GENE.GHRR01033500.1~~GHRR01033500.1.p1  ORF type:complete len:107 (+),score=6.87 GHRR01033500.1:62-382(+)